MREDRGSSFRWSITNAECKSSPAWKAVATARTSVIPSTMLLVLHRYRALAVRESITALRASLPPAADAPPETLPEREALVTALDDFDIGSSVGLSAPFLLPECQPAEWANARRNKPFPEGLRGDASCRHCTIRIKSLTGKTLRWYFEEAEAAPLRPGESIWSRIYLWEIAHVFQSLEGTPPDQSQFMFDDAGTWRTLGHPFLSFEAYGVFGAEIALHMTLSANSSDRERRAWNLNTRGISGADVSAVDPTAIDRYPRLVEPFDPRMSRFASGKAGWVMYTTVPQGAQLYGGVPLLYF